MAEAKKDDLKNFKRAFIAFLVVTYLGVIWALSALMPASLAFVIATAVAAGMYTKLTSL